MSREHEMPIEAVRSNQGSGGWRKWLAIALALVVVLGGGTAAASVAGLFTPQPTTVPIVPAAPGSTVSISPTPTPTPTPTPVGPRWPLTGMPGPITERPALVVKVENSEFARPQTGLDSADIVFEEMVEGGISRYVAMFHSNLPFHIEPVRSIRPMDGPIAGWTHGLMIFAGGKDPFKERAQADGLQLISSGSGLGRVTTREAPHNLAGNPEKLLERADADHQASPPAFCDFALKLSDASAIAQGTPATQLNVDISTIAQPHWTWDATSSRWLRWEKTQPAVVDSGSQLSATNVILVSVDVVYLDLTDSIGTRIPESIVVGQGTGLVAGGGKTVPITWKKDSETSTWQFLDASGVPIQLLPGNTWVELVPTSGSWSVS